MSSEESYQHACMRAELLGRDKPNFEQFLQERPQTDESDMDKVEIDGEIDATEASQSKEQKPFSGAYAKIGEFGDVLKSTQEKITNFAVPFSDFLKSKLKKSNGNQESGTEEPKNS